MVSDEDFAEREERWSFDVPDTKEAYLIRRTFDGKQATRKSLVEVLTFSFPFLFRHVPLRNRGEDSSSMDPAW